MPFLITLSFLFLPTLRLSHLNRRIDAYDSLINLQSPTKNEGRAGPPSDSEDPDLGPLYAPVIPPTSSQRISHMHKSPPPASELYALFSLLVT
ncbi:hypothetical protein ARMSODRAFT_804457 [Armillaria solidipes]|uniref:Uncharacterized protein n=1 Tax=Armillaria solidipes TaxID=1076256 RepID=A0A2H3AWM8_9AGAR|nr:hypothetical protein ARMSODRAFT_804457 [Armillaria solidipes]